MLEMHVVSPDYFPWKTLTISISPSLNTCLTFAPLYIATPVELRSAFCLLHSANLIYEAFTQRFYLIKSILRLHCHCVCHAERH
jgi:hypothetical protein